MKKGIKLELLSCRSCQTLFFFFFSVYVLNIAIARLSHKPSWAGCIPAGNIKVIDCTRFARTHAPTVQLAGTANTFRGFLIQAREGGSIIGGFTDLPALTQTLNCDGSSPMVHYEERSV